MGTDTKKSFEQLGYSLADVEAIMEEDGWLPNRGPSQKLDELAKFPPHFQNWLYLLIRLEKPKNIIETGVRQGISTRFIYNAVLKNEVGSIISIDPTVSMPYIQELHSLDPTIWKGLEEYSDKALEELGDLQVDLFLHDSDHSFEVQDFEYRWAWDHLNEGGILCSDDYTWANHGAWAQFCEEVGRDFVGMGGMAAIRK